MDSNPLAEVFGYPINNNSNLAETHRRNRICPFHNKVASCTKNSAKNPLGVCSIFHESKPVITCPIRFTENWDFMIHASEFFFEKEAKWTSLREVRLNDKYGKVAGNIDYVLVSYDDSGHITDFGAIEIQAVYISGNITEPFEQYMKNREENLTFSWEKSPRPDYLSSSRKRLAPQLIYKGGILKHWNKKQVVVLQKSFFNTLPELPTVDDPKSADIMWLIYDMENNAKEKLFELKLKEKVFTEFTPALNKITTPEPGEISEFLGKLQRKLDEILPQISPDAPILTDEKLT